MRPFFGDCFSPLLWAQTSIDVSAARPLTSPFCIDRTVCQYSVVPSALKGNKVSVWTESSPTSSVSQGFESSTKYYPLLSLPPGARTHTLLELHQMLYHWAIRSSRVSQCDRIPHSVITKINMLCPPGDTKKRSIGSALDWHFIVQKCVSPVGCSRHFGISTDLRVSARQSDD